MSNQDTYTRLLADIATYIEGETDPISIMANVTALIHERCGFFWTGFYLVADDEQYLHLGPFQGSAACFRIPYGRGVCGTAWKEERTQIVPDVEQFPGHIACSSLSRSEIVVPLFDTGHRVVAVLDIDSTELNTFTDVDAHYLEQICQLITDTIPDFNRQ